MRRGTRTRLRWAAAGATAFALTAPARAQTGIELLSPDTFILAGDVRLLAADGERAWVEGGFGKLRFGADSDGPRVRAVPASADIVWQPKLGWALSATVVGTAERTQRIEAGLSEAYLSLKPLGHGRVDVSARAGLMWPAVSLEHSGPEWAVRDTITPSAINSWIGEEVKFVGAEATLTTGLTGGKLSVTGGIVDADDTAGALIAFRGWALHDLRSLAWRKYPLPRMNPEMESYQPYFTHPQKEMDGFLKRPGWLVRTAWQLRAPIRVEAIHYDNGSNPEAVDAYNEWGWRTRFDNVGVTALVAPATELRMQAMAGRTRMGFAENGHRWIETRFRSAFALLTRRFGEGSSIAARAEAFDTRNRGSELTGDDDEHGWAATVAGKRRLTGTVTALVELLHVQSHRAARERVGLAAGQGQNQLQGALRFRW